MEARTILTFFFLLLRVHSLFLKSPIAAAGVATSRAGQMAVAYRRAGVAMRAEAILANNNVTLLTSVCRPRHARPRSTIVVSSTALRYLPAAAISLLAAIPAAAKQSLSLGAVSLAT